MTDSIVIMGVAGCGKSSLGAVLAQAAGLRLVEGDDFHSAASRDKMARGIALTDADRDGWLSTLSAQLRAHPEGLVLTCSALKKAYRERLRQAAPGLRFVFLDISREQAEARVAARAQLHFFSSSLVDSQFATLEAPTGEAGVLRVDALKSLAQLQAEVTTWLNPHKEQA
ncbi:MAG: gluconokinase [Polaromonas sp.]|jgi:gluconokinase|uniref:gluconokinase n=1 Tax=Polaromonas sp. TaxID=1869339 RepID=UPI0027300D95|nr:gluconokinase [Polaromonas sp.]MDP2257354.1 gluconokinase [Polaromonas sp.]MDP3707172.1 gluconokinase [Polaromonas sp.]